MAGKGIAGSLTRQQEYFCSLLRNALFDSPLPEPFALTTAEWNAVFAMAGEQRVLGLLARAVSRLDAGVEVPESVVLRLLMASAGIRRKSLKVRTLSESLLGELQTAGFHPVLMKGPAVAAFYPEPDLRASGDIDLYLPEEEFEDAVDYVRVAGSGLEQPSDGSALCMRDGVIIDLHPKFFDLHIREELLPAVPSAEATLLMLSSHILKHCMGPGIGVRQLCDMAMAYRKLPFDRQRLLDVYEKTGTLRWNRLLCAFLRDVLETDPGLFPGDETSSETLLRIVMEGGDFGHYSASRARAEQTGVRARKLDTALRFVRRIPFSLGYSPREFFYYVRELTAGNLDTRSGRV